MNIEENIKQRIGWLEKRMGLTNNDRELIIFQMKELAQQLTLTDVVVPKGTLPLGKLIKEIEEYEHGQQTHIIPRTPERMRTILAATHWCKKIAERLTNK